MEPETPTKLFDGVCMSTPSPPQNITAISTPSPFQKTLTPSPFKISGSNSGNADTGNCQRGRSKKRLFNASDTSTHAHTAVRGRGRGRPSKVARHADLVPVVHDYIQGRGFAAHERRRDTIGTVGVSLREIQEHAMSEIPALASEGISLSTISRMFPAPNKSRSASKWYKGLIPARVAKKANTKAKGHADTHFAAAK